MVKEFTALVVFYNIQHIVQLASTNTEGEGWEQFWESLGQPGNDCPGLFSDGVPAQPQLIILPASLHPLEAEVRVCSLVLCQCLAYLHMYWHLCSCVFCADACHPPLSATPCLPVTRKCALTGRMCGLP